jgi:hypothetical protein
MNNLNVTNDLRSDGVYAREGTFTTLNYTNLVQQSEKAVTLNHVTFFTLENYTPKPDSNDPNDIYIEGLGRFDAKTEFNKTPNFNLGINVTSGPSIIVGDLSVTGNITSSSDKKLKNNITRLEYCLEKIKNVNGYRYNRLDLSGEEQIGLIAQEVETNFPELVFEKNDIKSINYLSFIAVLLECIKELKGKIEILENKILI